MEHQRRHLQSAHEQLLAVSNETKKPQKRARHHSACKNAVIVFFRYLSGGLCCWESVAEKDFTFSCPLLPAQKDSLLDTYARVWQGASLRDVARAFPGRLEGLLEPHLPKPLVATTFELTDMIVDGLVLMCRFDLRVRVSAAARVFPLVFCPGMAKCCFSLDSKLISLSIRFDVCGLLRDLEAQTGVPLLGYAISHEPDMPPYKPMPSSAVKAPSKLVGELPSVRAAQTQSAARSISNCPRSTCRF
jgi:hypothetical protein